MLTFKPRQSTRPLNRGIAHHAAAVADDHRNLFGPDLEAVQKFLGRLVGIEIDVGVRMSVPAEEFAQAEGLRGVAGTHQDEVAEALPDEGQAAQNEGPHENLAQLGVRAMRARRPSALSSRNSPAAGDAAAHEGTLPGDHGHLAGELAGVVGSDGALAVQAWLDDLHAAGEQNIERDFGVPGFEQDIAGLHGA